MKLFLLTANLSFLGVMLLAHPVAASNAEEDIVSLPTIEMEVMEPVEVKAVYEFELTVLLGDGALIGTQKKVAFVAVLRRDLCATMLDPGKGPEGLWYIRSAVLKAARNFFRPITVKDVRLKEMSRTGPDAGSWSIPDNVCAEPAKNL